MCDTTMRVLIKGEECEVDTCIIDLVLDLQCVGTTSSCCGHGKGPGYITLKDGRHLYIMPTITGERVSWRDIWYQLKSMLYEALWQLGFIEEVYTTYNVAWPLRLVGVRK